MQENAKLIAYVDSDYCSDKTTRRSMSGCILYYNGSPILWRSKKQHCVTKSTTEAELIAASMVGSEVVYVRKILSDLGEPQSNATIVYEDNKGVNDIVRSNTISSRMKHLDVAYFYARQLQHREIALYTPIESENNTADMFTKPLPAKTFQKFRSWMVANISKGDVDPSSRTKVI